MLVIEHDFGLADKQHVCRLTAQAVLASCYLLTASTLMMKGSSCL